MHVDAVQVRDFGILHSQHRVEALAVEFEENRSTSDDVEGLFASRHDPFNRRRLCGSCQRWHGTLRHVPWYSQA